MSSAENVSPHSPSWAGSPGPLWRFLRSQPLFGCREVYQTLWSPLQSAAPAHESGLRSLRKDPGPSLRSCQAHSRKMKHTETRTTNTEKAVGLFDGWQRIIDDNLSIFGRVVIQTSSGIRKAAVLPLPVSATPMMSRFCKPMGMACLWIGVGSWKKIKSIPIQTTRHHQMYTEFEASGRFREENLSIVRPCSRICRWPPGCDRAEHTPSSSWWGSGSFLLWWWCCNPLWRFSSLCPSSRPTSSETSVCRPNAAWLPSYAPSSVLSCGGNAHSTAVGEFPSFSSSALIKTSLFSLDSWTHSSCSFSSSVRLFSIRSP